jgi:hypothetical protein
LLGPATSIYPQTKMDEARMVALVKKIRGRAHHREQRRGLGSERSPEWCRRRPRCWRESRRARRSAVETIVWHKPVAFFSQSGRLEVSRRRPSVDQTRLHEGSSVLQGPGAGGRMSLAERSPACLPRISGTQSADVVSRHMCAKFGVEESASPEQMVQLAEFLRRGLVAYVGNDKAKELAAECAKPAGS